MTPEELERAAARHWRAPDEEYLGDWLLRAADGFTGRANSALPLGDPGRTLADALAEVVDWYRARNLPAMIQLPTDHMLDISLSKRRWVIRPAPAIVMTADLTELPAAEASFDTEPDDGWLRRYNYRGSTLPPIAKTVLLSAPEQYFASIRRDGETIAIARLSLDSDGLAGLTAIEVDPAYRRQGLGTTITAAACTYARTRGAKQAFLQVATDNTPARTLYESLGFRDSHEYHYRVAP
ncbi:MAG: GNAT family N-acetyltransferase [Streptosporangiaceae bacterium]|jgi:ribosomal protein S18 acetylase RimI-like enzyme